MTLDYLSLGDLNMLLAGVIGKVSVSHLRPVYTHEGVFIGLVGEDLRDVKRVLYSTFRREEERPKGGG